MKADVSDHRRRHSGLRHGLDHLAREGASVIVVEKDYTWRAMPPA